MAEGPTPWYGSKPSSTATAASGSASATMTLNAAAYSSTSAQARPAASVLRSHDAEMLSCFANEELLREEIQRLSLSSSSSLHAQSSSVLPWDKFAEWLTCVCVVTFDLELGQAMELVYPGHVGLTETEKTSICYLAFPDSNSGCMGDTRFHFRFRRDSPAAAAAASAAAAAATDACSQRTRRDPPSLDAYDRGCPMHLQTDPGYYWGYVYFRQVGIYKGLLIKWQIFVFSFDLI